MGSDFLPSGLQCLLFPYLINVRDSVMFNESIITLMMEAVHTSETSAYSNETTGRYIP
jgi:hypothetical protein